MDTSSEKSRKAISDRAKKMEDLIGQILWYLDNKQKPPKPSSEANSPIERFCLEAKNTTNVLESLQANSSKNLRDPATESTAAGRLELLRELLKPLRKLK
jgi:hypothetical protein